MLYIWESLQAPEKPEEKVDIPELTEEEKEKAKKEFMQETFDKNTFMIK